MESNLRYLTPLTAQLNPEEFKNYCNFRRKREDTLAKLATQDLVGKRVRITYDFGDIVETTISSLNEVEGLCGFNNNMYNKKKDVWEEYKEGIIFLTGNLENATIAVIN